MKLALIGGAGVRTPSMIGDLIRKHQEIPISELYIHDISQEKIDTIGAIIQHTAQQLGSPFTIRLTTDFSTAVQGADFIYLAVRVGGEESRIIDERVALNYGILGQETTGPGGFAMALRTIPVMLRYAEIIEREAPNAWVVNFTNPAGLITEALHKHTSLKIIGICDAPSAMKLDIARFLDESPDAIRIRYFGLNHLGWIDQIAVRGRNRLPELINNYDRFTDICPHMACFTRSLIEHLGMLPNEYLYYFYFREQAVHNILNSPQTRGEQIVEINRKLLADLKYKLQQGQIEDAVRLYNQAMTERQNSYMSAETGSSIKEDHTANGCADTEPLQNEGYSGLAIAIMSAIYNNKKTNLVLNVPNQGAIRDLKDNDIVEISCMLDSNGPVPIAAGTLPDCVSGLVQSVKQYERYTISSAVNGSYEDALMALTVHPLVASHSLAKKLVDDYLQQHNLQLT